MRKVENNSKSRKEFEFFVPSVDFWTIFVFLASIFGSFLFFQRRFLNAFCFSSVDFWKLFYFPRSVFELFSKIRFWNCFRHFWANCFLNFGILFYFLHSFSYFFGNSFPKNYSSPSLALTVYFICSPHPARVKNGE